MARRDVRTEVLVALASHGPATVPVIAELIDADAATVRNQLGSMVRPTIGWVARQGIGSDRYEWSITALGRERIGDTDPQVTANISAPDNPRDVDVRVVVDAWRRGRRLRWSQPEATDKECDDAAARRVLDELVQRGWRRPNETAAGTGRRQED